MGDFHDYVTLLRNQNLNIFGQCMFVPLGTALLYIPKPRPLAQAVTVIK